MKTMNELREILCEEIDSLRKKETTAQNVSAVVNATGKILATVRMEIEYAKAMGRRPLLEFIELRDVETPALPDAPNVSQMTAAA